ncbi:hypothetical protein J6590_039312 [Homalodisca vitripennis]|nr:hypothetical protein J6590_039312 [Homalodisca vitripennis]
MGHSVRVFTVLFVPLWTCRYNAVMADATGRSPSNETNLPDIDKSDRWVTLFACSLYYLSRSEGKKHQGTPRRERHGNNKWWLYNNSDVTSNPSRSNPFLPPPTPPPPTTITHLFCPIILHLLNPPPAPNYLPTTSRLSTHSRPAFLTIIGTSHNVFCDNLGNTTDRNSS